MFVLHDFLIAIFKNKCKNALKQDSVYIIKGVLFWRRPK